MPIKNSSISSRKLNFTSLLNRLSTLVAHCVFLLFLTSAATPQDSDRISLNGEWELIYWQQDINPVLTPEKIPHTKSIKATVPGNVELDLLNAGIIDNPEIGDNVNRLRNWEGMQWCYSKKFPSPKMAEAQRAIIRFDGIDCLAEIWLNGNHIGSTSNSLISHSFDITHHLKRKGDNHLQVILRSPVIEGQNKLLGTVSIGNFPSEEAIYIRKAPHSYGWDIMPRLVSAGLWRDVEIEITDPVHFRDVNYITARVDTASREATLYIDSQVAMPFSMMDSVKIQYTIRRNGETVYSYSKPVVSPAFRHTVNIENADLWWPAGYGEPALYDCKTELVSPEGDILAVNNQRIGIRTVELDRNDVNLPDSPGKFRFIVNGTPIFVRGTNWVPLDALHSRDNRHLLPTLDMVKDLNCNMIRCWGGNVYESKDFYDYCDENGIMVWQDFAMGCTVYPQRDDFVNQLKEEVQQVVLSLRNHPSLVLWSGNNENDASLRWSSAPFNIDPNRDVTSRKAIAEVLYEFDPVRPYLPSSPYYSQAVYDHGSNDDLLPENHLWGPRGYYKDPYYKDSKSCFVSEIGYHGCPDLESLKKMMTPQAVYPWTHGHQWNEEWLTKSTRRFPSSEGAKERNNLMLNQIKIIFGAVPDSLDYFIKASQSVQAEAMKYFIELWRGNKWNNKTGIIWWNVRDGWPIISDAIVDYYGNPKRAYGYIRNAQPTVSVFINELDNDSLALRCANDSRLSHQGKVSVTDLSSDTLLYKGNFSVEANGLTDIATIKSPPGQGILKITYNIDDQDARVNHFLYGKPPYDLNEYLSWTRQLNY